MVKEKKIITRLEDNLFNEIERFSQDKDWSKSKLTRFALQEYLFTFGTPVQYVICSGAEYKFLLECLNEDQIHELAIRAYREADKFRNYLIKDYIPIEDLNVFKLGFKPHLNILIRNMFKSENTSFFDKINTITKKNWLLISGEHKLGLNFSKYCKYFLMEFLRPFDYKLQKETIENSKFIIEFGK